MALAPVTNKFVYLEDGQAAIMSKSKVDVRSETNKKVRIKTHEVDSNAYTTDLEGLLGLWYKHLSRLHEF